MTRQLRRLLLVMTKRTRQVAVGVGRVLVNLLWLLWLLLYIFRRKVMIIGMNWLTLLLGSRH